MADIDQHFMDWFNKAARFSREDKLEECITTCRDILSDPDCSRYYSMRAFLLLANTVGDWEEANNACGKADELWVMVNRWHTRGVDDILDTAMDELRVGIDKMKVILEEEEQELYGEEDSLEDVEMIEADEDITAVIEDKADTTHEAVSLVVKKAKPTFTLAVRQSEPSPPVSSAVNNPLGARSSFNGGAVGGSTLTYGGSTSGGAVGGTVGGTVGVRASTYDGASHGSAVGAGSVHGGPVNAYLAPEPSGRFFGSLGRRRNNDQNNERFDQIMRQSSWRRDR